MKIAKFQCNMFGENCYLVYNPESRETMVVDPGMITEQERKAVDDFIADNRLLVKYQVNTHMHLDHSFGCNHIAERYGVTTMAHKADHSAARNIRNQARMFGIAGDEIADVENILPLADGEILTLGNETVNVIHTPGHTPGGVCLYAPEDGWVITGDTLFAGGSIGRTDLPGGNYDELVESIRSRLLTLPSGTRILPGHGPADVI